MIPDRPGNNRLDTLTNLLANPQVGLLFLIPGVDETLRVNGIGRTVTDSDLLARCTVNSKPPKSGLLVEVREAYLHCGKALIRARLWHDDKIARSRLPTLGQMVNDQVQDGTSAAEADARIERTRSTEDRPVRLQEAGHERCGRDVSCLDGEAAPRRSSALGTYLVAAFPHATSQLLSAAQVTVM